MAHQSFPSAPSLFATAPSSERAEPASPELSVVSATPSGLLRHILASHPNAVVLVNSTGKIVYANGHTAELTGYSEAELGGMQVDELVPETSRGSHEHDRDSYLAAPEARPMGSGRDLQAVRSRSGCRLLSRTASVTWSRFWQT